MHIVVLLWSNGWIKIPVAFKIWMPKDKCKDYHTKGELAIEMINFVHNFGLAAEYVTFDTLYASKALLALLTKYVYTYVCMLKNNRKVMYNNRHNLNVKTICLLFLKNSWGIEVFFRDIKQYLCFEKVQVRNPYKLEGYFSAVFIAFTFVQVLRIENNFAPSVKLLTSYRISYKSRLIMYTLLM